MPREAELRLSHWRAQWRTRNCSQEGRVPWGSDTGNRALGAAERKCQSWTQQPCSSTIPLDSHARASPLNLGDKHVLPCGPQSRQLISLLGLGDKWASILSPEPLSQRVHNELPSAAVEVEGNQNQLLENTFKRLCLLPNPLLFSPLSSSPPQLYSSLLPGEVVDCHVGTGWGPSSQRSPLS